MELLETIAKHKNKDIEVAVHLITSQDDYPNSQQQEYLKQIAESCSSVGIHFTWELETGGAIHARHIVTDHGWKILLDRGLDIFQRYEMGNAFTFVNRLQEFRFCKAFEVTFLRT